MTLGVQVCDCKHDRLWVRVPLEDFFLNLYLHFFALASRQSATLSSATQYADCLQNSADNGKGNVLTLNSLCLTSCVRDTA